MHKQIQKDLDTFVGSHPVIKRLVDLKQLKFSIIGWQLDITFNLGNNKLYKAFFKIYQPYTVSYFNDDLYRHLVDLLTTKETNNVCK